MKLAIKNLWVNVDGKEIIKGLDLEICPGEVVALMGPNGSGKSSLAYAVAGHPRYQVISNKDQVIKLDGEDLLVMSPDERANKGLFLAMQQPVGVPGVSVRQLLLSTLRSRKIKTSALDLKKRIEEEAVKLKLDMSLLSRGVNDGFSGGERKKMEILQMRIIAPKYAILDETDSGLDIDALKIVAKSAYEQAQKNNLGVLVITHYRRLLDFLKPDRVLIMSNGKIAREGGIELLSQLEKKGYESIR
jgi:Fe-S cluster assembly ATP-binding protein